MRRFLAVFVVLGPVLVVSIGVWIVRHRSARETQPLASGALRGANVLLVSIDTLRADHVGAYGESGALTPTIDGLAKDGLRFDRTYAHVPLTLPSHASLLTAAYPTRNGVRDNGAFKLDGHRATLATVLKHAGYRTGAFLGAFVLDARFGLNHGFDVYDDRMLGTGAEQEMSERRADSVVAPAADWILAQHLAPRPTHLAPWFAWVHLYDPHAPYAPPEPYASQYASEPYDGEIAYADAALGRFLGRLRAAGALTNTLVVVLSDHGESLGEHGERTHGLFAYDATLRVPLVMYAPAAIRPGVVHDPMRLVDVAPTILDLVSAPALEDADGRTVRPFIAGERPFEDPGSYFEALDANLTRDWAPLRGIVRGFSKLIDLPEPELYDLASDPGEQHNLYARQPERARQLEAELDRISNAKSAAVPTAPVSADAEARLRSLGYVVPSGTRPPRRYTAADDPKRLVHLNAALDEAAAMWARGDRTQAIETLRGVIRERPTLTIAYDRLAFMLRATGRVSDAVALLDQNARAGRADRPSLRLLGSMLRDAGDLARSAAVLEPLIREDASDLESADSLAQTYARMGRTRDAEALFKRVLAASPNSSASWNNLGAASLTEGRIDDAIAAFRRALAIDPELATAHNGLGVAYARAGDLNRASAEWRRALELRPDYADARYNLERAAK